MSLEMKQDSKELNTGENFEYNMPQMLQISTRPWIYSLSSKYKRSIKGLKDIPLIEFQELYNRGIRVVWLMGLWNLGKYGLYYDRTNQEYLNNYAGILPEYKREDIIGSPYAITEYEVNPELGTNEDLVNLKSTLNNIGLKLMTDFVCNHSAVDSPTVRDNPEYYVRVGKGSFPPYDLNKFLPNGVAYGNCGWGAAWKDTTQFNYWNTKMRAFQVNNIMKIATFSDYIRCDMAHLAINSVFENNWGDLVSKNGYTEVQTEFWTVAISYVKSRHPNIKFLAEVYGSYQGYLQNCGFDFTYDKYLYDLLGNGNLDNIKSYLSQTDYQYLSRTAHFVENHDEPRAVAFFGSNLRADGAAFVSMTLPGMRFYFEGQQYGYSKKLDVHLRRAVPEIINEGVFRFYKKFTSILRRAPFHNGSWKYLNVENTFSNSWRLMAWQWSNNEENILVVANYSDEEGSGNVILNPQTNESDIDLIELISGIKYNRNVETLRKMGLTVIVRPWSGQIFSYSNK